MAKTMGTGRVGKTISPAVDMIADRTDWQPVKPVILLGEVESTPILGNQVSVGGRRLYRW